MSRDQTNALNNPVTVAIEDAEELPDALHGLVEETLDQAGFGERGGAGGRGRRITAERWPKTLDRAAYHGVLGEIVHTIAPADRGRSGGDPGAVAGHVRELRRPNAALSRRRRRASREPIRGHRRQDREGAQGHESEPVAAGLRADRSDWAKGCIASGLSSGEGLISAVRDPITGTTSDPRERPSDRLRGSRRGAGVTDKRLLAIETSSPAPEGDDAGGQHVVAGAAASVGWARPTHADEDERDAVDGAAHQRHRAHLERTTPLPRRDGGGKRVGNRFLWVLAKRSKELPHGGNPVALRPSEPARLAVDAARRAPELRRDVRINSGKASIRASRPAGLGCWAR